MDKQESNRFPPLLQRRTKLAILAAFLVLALVGGLVLRAASGSSPRSTRGQTADDSTPTETPTPTDTPTPTETPTPTPTPPPIPRLVEGQYGSLYFMTLSPGATSEMLSPRCPAGYAVVGGGISAGDGTYTVVQDVPISTTEWQAKIYNPGPSPVYRATANFGCLGVEPLMGQAWTITGQIISVEFGTVSPGTHSAILDATCPSGYLVASGGFESDSTTMTVMKNDPISTTRWQGEVYNSGSSPITAQMRVECLAVSGLSLAGQVLTESFGTVGSGKESDKDIVCPSGYLVVGGGVASDATSILGETDLNDEGYVDNLVGRAVNTGSSSVTAQLRVLCLAVSGKTG
jgi:hypothetical protein